MTPCCLFTDDAVIESDLDAFDCDTCRIRQELDGLDEENRTAWTCYRKLSRRIVGDLEARGVVLDRITRGLSPDDFDALVDRLNVIHDVLQPPKPDA